jgi:hypothetical protein
MRLVAMSQAARRKVAKREARMAKADTWSAQEMGKADTWSAFA